MLAKIQTNVDKYFFYISKISGKNNLKIQKICQNNTKYIFFKCSKNNIKNIIFIYYILK